MSVPRLSHHSPRFSFGLAILHEFDAFVQVALREKLEKQEVLVDLRHFRPLCALGLDYLNDLCGLSPGKGQNEMITHTAPVDGRVPRWDLWNVMSLLLLAQLFFDTPRYTRKRHRQSLSIQVYLKFD